MAHENWQLLYAGVELPPPDENGITFALQPIDDVETNADGDLFIQPVTRRYTVAVSWSALTGEETHLVMSTLDNNRSGILIFYNIATDSIDEMEVYHGAGTSITYKKYDDDLESQSYTSLRVNFISITGKKY